MVKVIFKHHKIRCSRCRSLLKYDTDDLKVDKRFEGIYKDYYIECPVCKNGVEVSVNQYKS